MIYFYLVAVFQFDNDGSIGYVSYTMMMIVLDIFQYDNDGSIGY